jgi:hypothetical protein
LGIRSNFFCPGISDQLFAMADKIEL